MEIRNLRAEGGEPERDVVLYADVVSYQTEHFNIETTGDYAATEEELQLLGEIFEEVWAAQVDDRGFLAPTTSGLFNVYLERLGAGLYGYTDIEGRSDTYISMNAVMGWTGSSTEDAWRVTAAHEFFHAVQFEYDYWEASWWMEATAVWMEDEVYDDLNDYHYYMTEGQWPDYPEISPVAENGWHEYGQFILPRYLTTVHPESFTILDAWERCEDEEVLDVLPEMLGGEEAFREAMADMAARNIADYSGFEEGSAWYPVYQRPIVEEGAAFPATVEPTEYRSDYLGNNYFTFTHSGDAAEQLVVDFEGDANRDGQEVTWQVSLVGMDGAAYERITAITTSTLSLTLPGFGRDWSEGAVVVSILSDNTRVNHDAYQSTEGYEGQPPTYRFAARLEADTTPPDDTGSDDTGATDSGNTDSGVADDTDGPKKEAPAGCGCDAGAGAEAGLAAGMGVLLLARRRR